MMACARASAVSPSHHRFGGVLLEILIAIALFAGAASFSLGAIRSAFHAIDQTRRKQQAIDLARSKMAELEAGLINMNDLRAGRSAEVSDINANDSASPADEQWVIDAKTYRSEFAGLSLIELTVRERAPTQDDSSVVQYVLRQLVALRPSAGDAYEDDELMEEAVR